MRTVYLEQPAAPAGQPTIFEARYVYESAAWLSGLNPDTRLQTAAAPMTLDTGVAPRPPHLDLTPAVHALAREIVGTTETDPVRKAGLIWRWIDTHIRYSAEMEYSVMPAIVEKILAERKGDCGVQALLFIALCRASGVPARWQSGWVTRPGAWNMHDWAEFHAPGLGWIPADPSVGTRKSDDPRVRDFFFGNLDAYRMIANLDYSQPFDPPKRYWPSDPVDNQRGEVEWDGGNLYYDQWDYAVTVETEPVR
jgi:transglutaminase-like putative cysteine protease